MIKTVAVLCALVAFAAADIYMHHPPGSNNRHREANTNRNNANRLFDSQNNGKGGYCWGPALTYYTGSQLTIEWTNQHGCNNDYLYCNIVLQYMCSSSDQARTCAKTATGETCGFQYMVRQGDGSAENAGTDRIPNTLAASTEAGANGGMRYCLHETYYNRRNCETRERNKGLYIADREKEGNLNNNRRTAQFTRQNNNGNRHGFECAEERDYYPYWHPSPWADIAILTHDSDWCQWYKDNSENNVGKGYCVDGSRTDDQLNFDANDEQLAGTGGNAGPNNEVACRTQGGRWVFSRPNGSPGPDCQKPGYSRDNHLGNGFGGYANVYNWTIPSSGRMLQCLGHEGAECNCVLRIRYNISQSELLNKPFGSFADWTKNDNGHQRKSIEFNPDDPTFKDTPLTGLFYDDMIQSQDGLQHHLAFDTSQFGRTFEDRSHIFHIKRRPGSVADIARIYNLGVRGKRGNIVQAYPSVEYDFIPNVLHVRQGDFIHFQWTGCDTNPNGNAGEGTEQTDRSAIVQIANAGTSMVAPDSWMTGSRVMFESAWLRRHMAYAGQLTTYERTGTGCPYDSTGVQCRQLECLDYDALAAKNNNNENNIEQDAQNCMKLNGAPTPYFDGGVVAMNNSGTFWYMNSRNNNFTNRAQKGKIVVDTFLPTWAIVMVVIGGAFFVASIAIAGAMLYAKNHPHSRVAHYLSKL